MPLHASPAGWLRGCLAFAFVAASAQPLAADDSVLLTEGRHLTEQFQRGEAAAIYARMSAPMRKVAGSVEGLARFRLQVLKDFGPEQVVLSETEAVVDAYRVYRRISRYTRAAGPVLTEWTFDDQLAIVGFVVKPDPVPAPSRYLDYQTHARLRLPFDGAWYVFWGGRTVEQNQHAVVRDQRFAYDFVVAEAGRTYAGGGTRVEDFHSWNRPVRAPAAASVVSVVDGIPDNSPGRMDPAHLFGNHVILDLGNGEFALLAHLRSGSVGVREGQHIETGAEIGRCGNSGNTSEPHLHFHLQDNAQSGDGLPAFFNDYTADGKPVARGEPVRGQMVANTPVPAAAP